MDIGKKIQQLERKLQRFEKKLEKAPAVEIAWIPLPSAMVALGKRSLKPRYFERGKRVGQLKCNVGDVVPMSYPTIMKMLRKDPSFELRKLGGNWFITKYPPDFARIFRAFEEDDAA
jgi:hypothetical protein